MNKRIKKKQLNKSLFLDVTKLHPEKDDVIVFRIDYDKLSQFSKAQIGIVMRRLSKQIKKDIIVLPTSVNVETMDKKTLKTQLLELLDELGNYEEKKFEIQTLKRSKNPIRKHIPEKELENACNDIKQDLEKNISSAIIGELLNRTSEEDVFGKMRCATEEEQRCIDDYIRQISKPLESSATFNDLLNRNKIDPGRTHCDFSKEKREENMKELNRKYSEAVDRLIDQLSLYDHGKN